MNTLTFVANKDTEIPLYYQLYEHLKIEIISKNIKFGSKLPSKRTLSEYLKISINTIQSAYDQLISEGYVEAVERKGFYVSHTDHLIHIKQNLKHQNVELNFMTPTVFFDFSYQGVDKETFPFNPWRKLYRDTLNEYDLDLLSPGNFKGNDDLRRSITKYLYESRGVSCSMPQVIISSGTEYLMQMLIQLLGQGKIFGIENPGYEKLNLLFRSNHTQYELIDIDDEGVRMDVIENKEIDIICTTPSHQFPTGGIMGIKRREALLNWANAGANRYIIEDDYDSEFKYTGKPIPALKGMDAEDKVIYLGAFSKSLSPALRISYMVLPKLLLEKFEKNLAYIKCPVPVLEQKVLSKFISDGYFERHLNKMRKVYKSKRDLLVNTLQLYKDQVRVLGADAGLHVLIEVRTNLNEQALVERARENGILVFGISQFYFNEKKPIRPLILIGYATMNQNDIQVGIHKLINSWFI